MKKSRKNIVGHLFKHLSQMVTEDAFNIYIFCIFYDWMKEKAFRHITTQGADRSLNQRNSS